MRPQGDKGVASPQQGPAPGKMEQVCVPENEKKPRKTLEQMENQAFQAMMGKQPKQVCAKGKPKAKGKAKCKSAPKAKANAKSKAKAKSAPAASKAKKAVRPQGMFWGRLLQVQGVWVFHLWLWPPKLFWRHHSRQGSLQSLDW